MINELKKNFKKIILVIFFILIRGYFGQTINFYVLIPSIVVILLICLANNSPLKHIKVQESGGGASVSRLTVIVLIYCSFMSSHAIWAAYMVSGVIEGDLFVLPAEDVPVAGESDEEKILRKETESKEKAAKEGERLRKCMLMYGCMAGLYLAYRFYTRLYLGWED